MVSVIVPVYNGAAFVEECLRSIMQQSYRNIEIIVINDGSTDNSYQICEKLAKEDGRITLMDQKNSGVSVTRNNGIAASHGEYIMFVDADDSLPTDAIDLLITDIEISNADMTIGSYETFRGNLRNKVVQINRQYSVNELRENMVLSGKLLPFVWGRLYKKAYIDKGNNRFVHGIPYGEDNIFNLDYCGNVEKVSVISSITYYYRLGGMASSVRYYPDKDKYALALVNAYKDFLECETSLLEDNFNRVISSGLHDCFLHYIVNVPFRMGLKSIDKVLDTFSMYRNPGNIVPNIYGKRLTEAILLRNTIVIYYEMYRKYFTVITKKKIKKLYYKVFSRRI